MRTFTLEDGQIVAGFPAHKIGAHWHIKGSPISLNRDCMPEVADGRVVTASLSKPHYPSVGKPANLDWDTWGQWLRETPSVGRSTTPVYTLRRAKNLDNRAVLVMFARGFRTEEGADWPTTHHCKDSFSQEIRTSIVRMTPGMRLLLDNGRFCLVYRHGADSPEYFSWRQWELDQAVTLASPTNVRCFTLEQTCRPREGFRQQCQPGIAVTSDTPLGTAIQLGTPERPEWLPLFDGRCPAVLQSAAVGIVGERHLQENRSHVDFVDREPKTRSVPLYGFTSTSESSASAYLVRVEGKYFHDSEILRGTPVFIRWQEDARYDDYAATAEGPVAFILQEGEAVGYRTRPQDRQSSYRADIQYVLNVRHGELQVTAYEEWRSTDMNEHAEEYLARQWGPQATLPNIPPSWLGCRVALNRDHIRGELVAIDGDSVLLRSDWSTDGAPRIKRYQALWVTRYGKPMRKERAENQRKAFVEARVGYAAFYETTTVPDLLATDGSRKHEIRPVGIVELGVCEKTGEVVCMYGAPSFEKGWGSYPWTVGTKWCETYQEAQQVRQTFIERFTSSTDKSDEEALVHRLKLERDHPSRYVW